MLLSGSFKRQSVLNSIYDHVCCMIFFFLDFFFLFLTFPFAAAVEFGFFTDYMVYMELNSMSNKPKSSCLTHFFFFCPFYFFLRFFLITSHVTSLKFRDFHKRQILTFHNALFKTQPWSLAPENGKPIHNICTQINELEVFKNTCV